MDKRQEIYDAIRKADAVGDVDSVRKLADYLGTIEADNKEPPKSNLVIPKGSGGTKEKSFLDDVGAYFTNSAKDTLQDTMNLVGGGIRGAGSIGATILSPIDIANDYMDGKGLSLDSNRTRRKQIDDGLRELGVDTDSGLYGVGKFGGEVAGTGGIGSLVTKGVAKLAPSLANNMPALMQAIQTGGMKADAAKGLLSNMSSRVAGGGINGFLSGLATNPEDSTTSAGMAAALPIATKTIGLLGGNSLKNGAEWLMMNAMKATPSSILNGKAGKAARVMLDEGANVSMGGVDKLQNKVHALNNAISEKIAGSDSYVDAGKVIDSIVDVRRRFTNQVNPSLDLDAINRVADNFIKHPNINEIGKIPVQQAQKMKQGTYSILKKKYGQVGVAETEAEKALARGLKEQIAENVPEVANINAKESEIINALKILGNRAAKESVRNPAGISALSTSPLHFGAMLFDRNSLLKSMMARGIDSTGNGLLKITPNQQIQQIGYYATPRGLLSLSEE